MGKLVVVVVIVAIVTIAVFFAVFGWLIVSGKNQAPSFPASPTTQTTNPAPAYSPY